MFVKLALKNIKRSIKDYTIYFFTLVLGVAIFYIFNTLDSQSVMLNVNDRVREMLDLINVIMGSVSVFIAFILGALIVYASRFLIKRRSKEFGIYLTLGMSKRKVSMILLLETFFIGLLSLVVGLIVGVLVSQLTSVLVANMFDANLTEFQFVFSLSACLQTLLYFGIIYLVVMIFNTVNISRQKLINLLSSHRHNEKVKLKNPWLCTVVFIVAAITLGVAYYLVTGGLRQLAESTDVQILLVPIAMGVVATFLLFWSLSGLLLRILMSFKRVYYNQLNSFVLRQFSSKINTTVVSMSFICLMLFVTICVLGSALSLNATLHENIERALPVDVQVEAMGETAVGIEEVYAKEDLDLNQLLKDVVTYRLYILENVSLADTLGNVMATIDENGDPANYRSSEYAVTLSDYNRVAELFSLPKLELGANEYAVLGNYAPMIKLRNQALANNTEITIAKTTLNPKFDHCLDGTLELEMAAMNGGILIVPDAVMAKVKDSYTREILIGNFVNPDRAAETEAELMKLHNRFFRNNTDGNADDDLDEDEDSPVYYYSVTTKQEIIDNNVGTSALVTFIGLYLGLIFLISSAAVLALKELSESSDNREKYTILRKIGASEKMLNHALFWQIFIFFLFPLLIAILHSIFGLMFCDYLLSMFGGIDIMRSLPGVCCLLAVIYGGYFVVTYLCSKNMIKQHS